MSLGTNFCGRIFCVMWLIFSLAEHDARTRTDEDFTAKIGYISMVQLSYLRFTRCLSKCSAQDRESESYSIHCETCANIVKFGHIRS
jgi:hypothetical protein